MSFADGLGRAARRQSVSGLILFITGLVALPFLASRCSAGGAGGGSLAACPATASGGASCASATLSPAPGLLTTSATNVIPLYIADPATTGGNAYSNEPLVSVTICTPNHTLASQCQTISNILLDTGSFGLRVFGSAIANNVNLAQQTIVVSSSTFNLAECQLFGSGADWGSVRNADVVMGSQTASNIPIQVIDIKYGFLPSGCSQYSPDTDPCSSGYNGILGVGIFVQDCGLDCTSTSTGTNGGQYYGCDNSGCYDAYRSGGTTYAVPVALAQQVANPVASFAAGYNNGVSVSLPYVGASGASAVSGSMTVGIGTIAGNAPSSGVSYYAADGAGMTDGNGSDFQTTFVSAGTAIGGSARSGVNQAFIDSGSNNYYFPQIPSLPLCGDYPGDPFFCPAATQALQASIQPYLGGSPSASFAFSIANNDALANTCNSAFANAGAANSTEFVWGLPFFYNQTIYVGIDGASAAWASSSGQSMPATGPFWAF
jgi:hypothetical protein